MEILDTQRSVVSKSIKRVIHSLEQKRFSKLICGASNTNKVQVERLSLIYALSGISAIDISVGYEIYEAAKTGINKAREMHEKEPAYFWRFNEPVIMVSLNAGQDPHFRKAIIDPENCNNCFDCISTCAAGALYQKDESIKLNEESCYGCGKCADVCSFDAISLSANSVENLYKKEEYKYLEEVESIEIHTGNCSISKVKDFVKEYSEIIRNADLISFSVESGLYNSAQLIEYVNSLIELVNKRVIIQIDGAPMSASNSSASSLQAIAAASILASSGIEAYIQIAGGSNHLTRKYLNLFGLDIAGVGYGTFAKKIILSYIEGFNEDEFLRNIKKFVNITTDLVRNYGNSTENSV